MDLKHTYGHWDFGEFLADTVFHDAPQVEGVVGFIWDAGPPLSAGLQLLPRQVVTAWRRLGSEGSVSDVRRN